MLFPPENLELLSDIPYGERAERAHLLDVLRPMKPSDHQVPAIFFLHGGGWRMFGKYPQINVFLAQAGFATISSNYRYSHEAIFPAQLEDTRAAVAWLKVHADQLGVDATRIGAWGISAGGHLASLLRAMGEVQAVVDVCGPSDFFDPAWRPEHWELLGGTVLEKPQLARLASPAHQISVDAADFLILHGATDLEVPLSQAERLHTALLKAGAQSELVIFPDGDHFINETHKPQIEKLALEFFCKTLGDPL